MRPEYSPFKIVHHPDKLQELKDGNQPVPVKLQISPTNRCNVHCKFCCYYGDTFDNMSLFSPKDELSTDTVIKYIRQAADMGVKAVDLTGGGDPLCHPGIIEILSELITLKMPFGMITNGTALDVETISLLTQAEYVRVSIDAATVETYKEVKGVKASLFEKLIEDLHMLCLRSPDTVIGVNFNVMHENYHEIPLAAGLFKGIGCDNIRIAPVLITSKSCSLGGSDYYANIKDKVSANLNTAMMLSDERFTVFPVVNQRLFGKIPVRQDYSFCPFKELVTFIGSDDNLYTCCNQAYSKPGLIGSMQGDFKSFWHSVDKQQFFTAHDPRKHCNNICIHREKNSTINYAIEADPRHKEFI